MLPYMYIADFAAQYSSHTTDLVIMGLEDQASITGVVASSL